MSSRPIVLHFDVNETIILLDSAQNFTTEITVNRILAKNAVGIVKRHSECDKGPHVLAPSAAWSADAALAPFHNDDQLRTALETHSWEYVESSSADAVSFKTFASDLFPDDDTRCNQLINAFTELPHGAPFRSTFQKLMAVLGDEDSLLPSFLHFVQWLCAQPREFRIVFRTFGSDLPLVVRLFNDFCEGRHPRFPNFRADGRNGTLDLRVDAGGPQSGMFLRRSDHLGDAHFRSIHASSHPPRAEDAQACQAWIAEATLSASPSPSPSFSSSSAATAATAASLSEAISAANSDINEAGGRSDGGSSSSSCRNIGAVFNAWIARFRVACVRDYYPMWRASDGLSTTGKLVFIHSLSNVDCDLHIFFDDYIAIDEHDPKCIVDARCALTSAPLPLSQTLGKHLLRVRTMDAISEEDYFIKAFQEAENC